ncbi:MAG TPA: hypothetical protein PLP19_12715 [bacterium]|nr:hypothetical protein [bacterium]HPN44347.1 hypothetical protein [bacterium]
MKKLFYIMILLGMGAQMHAQENPENALLFLRGGNTEVKFSYYSQLISGIGNSMGYKSKSPWDVWMNPASMVTFNRIFVGLNIQPPLWIDTSDFSDFNSTIEDEIDEAIQDYKTAETELVYPTLSAKVLHQGGLYGFQFVKPIRHHKGVSIVSFEIGQPFYMNINTYNDGLETLLETRKQVGDQNKIIRLRMNALLQLDMNIKATQYSAGWARRMNRNVALGLKLGRTHVKADMVDEMKMDGIMETAGTEYAFNDPYDPRIDFSAGETNLLGQKAVIDFNGDGWHSQVGALFAANKSFVFGVDFDWQSNIDLSGKMTSMQYKIPGLNEDMLFGGDEDDVQNGVADEEDLFDATKLDLAKLTLTEPVQNKTSDHLLLQFPSSLGLQASYQSPFFETTLGIRKYFNAFGYDFLDEKYMANLNFGLNLALVIGSFELDASAINAELVQEVSGEEKEATVTWIPGLSMKTGFMIAKNYQLDTRLFFAPMPGIGIKLGYFF